MSTQQLTYENVLELIRENSSEFSRLLKEQGAEFDRRMRERDAEFDRLRKDTNRKIGDLSSSVGRIVEHMIGERIIEKFRALGYGVTHPVRRNHSFENTKLGISGEFDLTLVDSDVIILIEVKTTLETSDVRKHIEKIEKYRRHIVSVGFVQPPFTHLLPTTRFFGAVAGAVVEEEAMEFAHENGLYTIMQSGEAVEIVPVPEGFKAREW
jgi:hypothetical protein